MTEEHPSEIQDLADKIVDDYVRNKLTQVASDVYDVVRDPQAFSPEAKQYIVWFFNSWVKWYCEDPHEAAQFLFQIEIDAHGQVRIIPPADFTP